MSEYLVETESRHLLGELTNHGGRADRWFSILTCRRTFRTPRNAGSCTSSRSPSTVSTQLSRPFYNEVSCGADEPAEIFAVPNNMKLHAIPVYEFYDNASRYGPQFAGLPYLLSK